jgi:hypothetical protein
MLFPEILVVRAWMASAITQVKATRDERGAVELGTVVVLGAIIVGGAIVIGGILINKFKDSANGIPTP